MTIIQLYRERYNVPPYRYDHLVIDGYMRMERAFVGNIEFLLPIPNNAKYDGHRSYRDKRQAVTELLKTSKGSDERRALIHFMVKEGLVPCKEKYLYTLVSQVEKNGMQILWNEDYRFGRPRRRMKNKWSNYHYTKQMKVIHPDKHRPWLLRVGTIDFQMPRNTQSNVYTKREALHHIAKTATKGSVERGAMICFMVQEGYVLCKEKCLTDLVRRVEVNHLPVGSDEWSKRGRPTKRAAAQNWMDSKRYNDDKIFRRDVKSISDFRYKQNGLPMIRKSRLLDRKGWIDHVMMWMIPIRFCDSLENLPKLKPQHIDICTYIGYSNDIYGIDEETFEEIVCGTNISRLYFPPQHFPPPKNLNDGGNSIEFAKVRLHIREASHVFCNGGKNEKIFTCDKNYKTGHIGPSCPFGFTVRWDRHGFYIHLSSTNQKYSIRGNAGCPFHCCSL